jgi:FtsH-binding integral membrane protein
MDFFDSSVSQVRDTFLSRVYGYMAGALVISAVTAYSVASSPAFVSFLFSSRLLIFGLMLAQLAVVVVLSSMLARLQFGTALALYFAYAVLTGMTLSSIFLIYKIPSIFMTFSVTAGMFLIMAVYGYVTKSDLSGMRNLLMMGLIGIILASIVNMFVGSGPLDLIIAAAGVVIFTMMIAYDVQRIKWLRSAIVDQETANKAAIIGALMLYLDFINLFLSLLRLLGRRKE